MKTKYCYYHRKEEPIENFHTNTRYCREYFQIRGKANYEKRKDIQKTKKHKYAKKIASLSEKYRCFLNFSL